MKASMQVRLQVIILLGILVFAAFLLASVVNLGDRHVALASTSDNTSGLIPTLLPQLPPPPDSFSPLTASSEDLAKYGFPPRPTNPQHLKDWEFAMSRAIHYVAPHPIIGGGTMQGLVSTDYSHNWAGYVVKANNNSSGYVPRYVSAEASWIQPGYSPGNPGSPVPSFWTGIGGVGSTYVVQAGAVSNATVMPTDQYNEPPVFPYEFWVEDAPQRYIFVPDVLINPGDQLFVNVYMVNNNSAAQAFLENETTYHWTTYQFDASYYDSSTAESIYEAYQYSTRGYAVWGQTYFSGCYASWLDGAGNPQSAQLGQLNYTKTVMNDTGTSNGTVKAAPTDISNNQFVVTSSSLFQLQTVPAVPTDVSLNGTTRDSWGLNNVKLQPGTYSLGLTDVLHYQKPSSVMLSYNGGAWTSQPVAQQFTVPVGITNVQASFTQLGNLHVTTNPAVPGTISVNGNPMDDWGMWLDLPAGQYTVSFGNVNGYQTPLPQVATVNAGQTTTITGNYITSQDTYTFPQYGLLQFQTVPALPTTISLNGAARDSWGLNWVKLPPGSYTVSLSDVQGWLTPASVSVSYDNGVTWKQSQSIQIANGQTTLVQAMFTQLGNLHVETTPAVPATLYVNGNPMDDWGFWTNLLPGQYTVSFQPLPWSYITPPPIVVSVYAGQTTHVIGNYSTGQSYLGP